jgi:signal transduction histidine kinase
MKKFAHRPLTYRKIILIFLLAIFLPSLIAGYLSLSTIPKRREAVKNLLESNLWVSGEAALTTVEGNLLEYEQQVLDPDRFMKLTPNADADKTQDNILLFSKGPTGRFFLLDADLHIIFPETSEDAEPGILFIEDIENSRFGQLMHEAENLEFSRKDYERAAGLYRESASFAPSDSYRAVALEGLGRSLLHCNEYAEAYSVYEDLSENYRHMLNKAGHPIGIVSVFQLYEISVRKQEIRDGLERLVALLKEIREGRWKINKPTYDFYSSEIHLILEEQFSANSFQELQNIYLDLNQQPSPYGEELLFTEFIESQAIPEIRQRIPLSFGNNGDMYDRFPLTRGEELSVISFHILPDFFQGEDYFGGFCWDLNYLKDFFIPGLFEETSENTGLDLQLTDKAISAENTRVMNFRMFPLPWKIQVSHPQIVTVERAAKREIFLYGVLLAVIVMLMLFGAVMIVRDISRESETTRLKTEFVNNISHELKTPLTLIRLYGDTLQRNKDLAQDERDDCYEIITKESERLSHLINNVLDFSRIDMGRKEFMFINGFLQDVISDTLESYRYHLEKKGFKIQSDISNDLPEIEFDGEAIASVFVNLLSNAMKFSPEQKEVGVRLYREKENAILEVADKGIGISEEELPKIFQRFYRSEQNIPESRGSGLGLTLVRHIAEAHGGRVEVKSEPGSGSVFSIVLPLKNWEKT